MFFIYVNDILMNSFPQQCSFVGFTKNLQLCIESDTSFFTSSSVKLVFALTEKSSREAEAGVLCNKYNVDVSEWSTSDILHLVLDWQQQYLIEGFKSELYFHMKLKIMTQTLMGKRHYCIIVAIYFNNVYNLTGYADSPWSFIPAACHVDLIAQVWMGMT